MAGSCFAVRERLSAAGIGSDASSLLFDAFFPPFTAYQQGISKEPATS